MSRSDATRADSRPGVRASTPSEREAPEARRAPTSLGTTLAYGVASPRREPPPPPPLPRAQAHATRPGATPGQSNSARGASADRGTRRESEVEAAPEQRDSGGLLDLVVQRPEELHLRFEPIRGIAPAGLSTAPQQNRAPSGVPAANGAPHAQRPAPATAHVAAWSAPVSARAADGAGRPAAPSTARPAPGSHAWSADALTDGSAAQRLRAGIPAATRSASPQSSPYGSRAVAVPPAPQASESHAAVGAAMEAGSDSAAAPRLRLRTPSQAPVEPTQAPGKRRYWGYAFAAIGAACFVGAGYSVAVLQLSWRDEQATPQTHVSAATEARTPVSVARVQAPAPAVPEATDGRLPTDAARDAAEPQRAARARAARNPSSRAARNAAQSETSARSAPVQAEAAPQPEPSAPPDPVGDEPAPSAQTREPAAASAAESPRLIITPLPDLPEPEAAPAEPAPQPSAAVNAEPQPQAAANAEPGSAPQPPVEALPEQPSRDDVQQRLLGMRDKLASCAGDQHGTSYANVTINGNGRVSHSTIEGAFAGTPAGSCMARTLRSASFPRFTGPQFTVRYPYVF